MPPVGDDPVPRRRRAAAAATSSAAAFATSARAPSSPRWRPAAAAPPRRPETMTDVVRDIAFAFDLRQCATRWLWNGFVIPGRQLWPSHDPIKAPTPTCCFAGWAYFKSMEVTLRGTIPRFSLNSKACARRAVARRSACRTSPINSTTPDGISGVRIVQIPQYCALFGGTLLSDGLKRRFLCTSHDANSSSSALASFRSSVSKPSVNQP